MSANRFKVGDKVRVRSGLVAENYYGDVIVNSDMRLMAGEELTIKEVYQSCYSVKENDWYWSGEMLKPAVKTLYNLEKGDFITNGEGARKILASLDGCYLISYIEDHSASHTWYTAAELDNSGHCPVEPDTPTIEINGKKYNKADVERAIKDLKPIE